MPPFTVKVYFVPGVFAFSYLKYLYVASKEATSEAVCGSSPPVNFGVLYFEKSGVFVESIVPVGLYNSPVPSEISTLPAEIAFVVMEDARRYPPS